MSEYETVIGLEVHVQLLTESKAFCGCSTKFGLSPNSATCPVCLGLPGSLPVLNKKAFLYAVKTALALNCKIQDIIKFDRKNYYYPDLPKNFQISQFDKPLGYGGFLEIEHENAVKKTGITRAHIEEDAGKLIHDPGKGMSYVDLNRAGIPLLEIVSEPDLHSPEEANAYLVALKSILQYLKVSDCNMEEGSLRCDANISVRLKGEKILGVKSELKNMNSFKAVRDALSYESIRHTELLAKGERIIQETRLWNETEGMTRPMRAKEESHDYRYFPEPDLVPFTVDIAELEGIMAALPELPFAKKKRFIREYALTEYDADILTRNMDTAYFFENTAKIVKNPKEIANWILGDISSLLKENASGIEKSKLTPQHLAGLLNLIRSEEITGKIAKEVLQEMFKTGSFPEEVVNGKGLRQIKDDGAISSVADSVLAENQASVEAYQKGKKNALMFLVGQVMKKTGGKANPKKVNEILKEKLENDSCKEPDSGR